MKVNRVFCFSKEIANQNGNKLPIMQLVLSTILFIVVIMVLAIVNADPWIVRMLIMIVYLGILIYYSILLGLRLRAKMSGWATTFDNRIFKAMTVNNGEGLYFGGVAVGSMVDQLSKNNNSTGRDLGATVGAIAQFYSIYKSAQYMSHPEIVAKMVELAPDITGAKVIEILKVHSITAGKHFVKVKCDYRILRTNKMKSGKNMYIEKSYNQFNDLINLINTHR